MATVFRRVFHKKIKVILSLRMRWYQDEEEEDDDLMFSPALLARRASESWIDSAPIEVASFFFAHQSNFFVEDSNTLIIT